MLDRFRVEVLESNNDEIVLRAEDDDVRVTAKIPCGILDRAAGEPLATFNERIAFSERNLNAFARLVERKFNAGEFRAYHGHDGRDRWIVLDSVDIDGLWLW